MKSSKGIHTLLAGRCNLQSVANAGIDVGASVYYDPATNVFDTLSDEQAKRVKQWQIVAIEKPNIYLSNGVWEMVLDCSKFWDESKLPEIGQVVNIEICFGED